MKRTFLLVCLLLTLCNISFGIAYGCTCTSKGGSVCCGRTCVANPNGTCTCGGRCPNEN